MERKVPAWVSGLAILTGTAAALWGLWCTVIGFIGGTMPLVGLHVDGGLGTGLLMLIVGEPILMTVAYWASMIVLLPLAALTARGSRP